LSTLDSLELNVSETLGGAGLTVGWQTDGLNSTVFSESVVQRVFVGGEGHVADPQGGAWRVLLVTELLGSLLRVLRGRSSGSVVDVDRSTVNLLAVQLDSLGGSLEFGKLDVTESTGSVLFSVHHDSHADDLTTFLELGLEPVVVDVPRERTDKDVLGRFLVTLFGVGLGDGTVLGLCLLGRGGSLLAGLSLAVGSGGLFLLFVGAVLVGRFLAGLGLEKVISIGEWEQDKSTYLLGSGSGGGLALLVRRFLLGRFVVRLRDLDQ
jgi:hypothetical protein